MIRMIRVLCLTAFAAPPVWSDVRVHSIRNSASPDWGTPRGGSLATIDCSGLVGPPGLVTAPAGAPLPFKLRDIGVILSGASAPILSIYIPTAEEAAAGVLQQIHIQVPMERNATVSQVGARDSIIPIVHQAGSYETAGVFHGSTLFPQSFGAFFSDGNGFAMAEHTSDRRPVTRENPARPGETITVYANDLFTVWPPPPMGIPVPEQPRFEFSPELAAQTLGIDDGYDKGNLYLQQYPELDSERRSYTNTPALKIRFQGLAVGKIGVEQIDFVVPANQPPGDWVLFFNVGSCPDGSGPCTTEARPSHYALLPVR
jgi:uncharacterized protein (TIGR03437 family)